MGWLNFSPAMTMGTGKQFAPMAKSNCRNWLKISPVQCQHKSGHHVDDVIPEGGSVGRIDFLAALGG